MLLNLITKKKKKKKIEDVIPKIAFTSDEAKEEIEKIVKIEKTIDREKLVYKASGKTYDFRKFQTTKTFGEDIYEVEITFKEADKEQSDLLDEIRNFNDKTRPKNYKKKQEKKLLLII